MAFGNETLRLAFKLVVRKPARSALTVLGLAIGVGAFIAMVSFGEGARRSVIAQFEVLGANLLKVQVSYNNVSPNARQPQLLNDGDVAVIQREATTVAQVLPVLRRGGGIAHGAEQRSTLIFGTTSGFLRAHAWDLAIGGMFDPIDLEQRAKVCVLGRTPARTLFADDDPLGQSVTLAGVLPCRVIGVLAEKGYSTSGTDLDDVVLLPSTTYLTQLTDHAGYSYIEVEPLSANLVNDALAEVNDVLRHAHRLRPDEPSDFSVSSPLEVIRAVDSTSRILTTLLAAIAAVSLLVGGIGIMNIQLVSVAERTQEIGVRAAIGASPQQILFQFLIEALILTLFGTTAGVAFGIAVASIVAELMAWPRIISASGVALSAGFGLLVGVVFGYLPARRAAALEPIHALRHE